MSQIGILIQQCDRAAVATPAPGDTALFVDTETGLLTQANSDGTFTPCADSAIIAGTGIHVDLDSAGRLIVSAALVAGTGIIIEPDSNGRLVISAL